VLQIAVEHAVVGAQVWVQVEVADLHQASWEHLRHVAVESHLKARQECIVLFHVEGDLAELGHSSVLEDLLGIKEAAILPAA
jgi:hypothetical protein